MIWQEQDHPRDEEGKFTNKGSEAQRNQTKNQEKIKPFKLSAEFNEIRKGKTPAEILLGNSKTAKEKRVQKKGVS